MQHPNMQHPSPSANTRVVRRNTINSKRAELVDLKKTKDAASNAFSSIPVRDPIMDFISQGVRNKERALAEQVSKLTRRPAIK